MVFSRISKTTPANLTVASASSNLVILILPAISAVTDAPAALTVFSVTTLSLLVLILSPHFFHVNWGSLSIKNCAEFLISEVSAGEVVAYSRKKLFFPILVGISNLKLRLPFVSVSKAVLSESFLYSSGSVVTL